MEANITYFLFHGPQKWLKYPPYTIQSTFSEKNDY